ncbi:hypothetical protein BD413DRAFT_562661 [Trametes elegans]|nr:hypothetical protein BD413DRAFT_562661 [Trametes elegans]
MVCTYMRCVLNAPRAAFCRCQAQGFAGGPGPAALRFCDSAVGSRCANAFLRPSRDAVRVRLGRQACTSSSTAFDTRAKVRWNRPCGARTALIVQCTPAGSTFWPSRSAHLNGWCAPQRGWDVQDGRGGSFITSVAYQYGCSRQPRAYSIRMYSHGCMKKPVD